MAQTKDPNAGFLGSIPSQETRSHMLELKTQHSASKICLSHTKKLMWSLEQNFPLCNYLSGFPVSASPSGLRFLYINLSSRCWCGTMACEGQIFPFNPNAPDWLLLFLAELLGPWLYLLLDRLTLVFLLLGLAHWISEVNNSSQICMSLVTWMTRVTLVHWPVPCMIHKISILLCSTLLVDIYYYML